MNRVLLVVAFGVMAFAQRPEFVQVPAGSFIMGCDPAWKCAQSLPKKHVDFDRPFLMSKTEVTVGEFRAFVKATGYRTDAEKAGETRNGRKLPNAWGLYDVEGNAMEWVRDGGPHSSITRQGAGSVRGGSYASCPEPYPPMDGLRQRAIGLGPTFPGFENSNFRPDERRFDYGVRCAK